MAVYVDALVEYQPPKDARTRRAGAKHGHSWCHMLTDSMDQTELREMAARVGLKAVWFQSEPGKLPHFDLTPPRRAKAISLGAVECGRAKLVECIRMHRSAGTPPEESKG